MAAVSPERLPQNYFSAVYEIFDGAISHCELNQHSPNEVPIITFEEYLEVLSKLSSCPALQERLQARNFSDSGNWLAVNLISSISSYLNNPEMNSEILSRENVTPTQIRVYYEAEEIRHDILRKMYRNFEFELHVRLKTNLPEQQLSKDDINTVLSWFEELNQQKTPTKSGHFVNF